MYSSTFRWIREVTLEMTHGTTPHSPMIIDRIDDLLQQEWFGVGCSAVLLHAPAGTCSAGPIPVVRWACKSNAETSAPHDVAWKGYTLYMDE